MSGSLEGPIAKVRRAIQHYRTLKDEFHGGVDHKLRAVTQERHRDGHEYRFRVGQIEPIDPAWPILMGEAYYNLRSALDHLVFQLHVRHFRGNVPADAVEESAFPIWERPREPSHERLGRGRATTRPTSQWKEIKRLGRSERTAIDWLQPFHGIDERTWPRPKTFVRQTRLALRDLNALNNIDKHRELHVCHSAPMVVPVPSYLSKYGFRQRPEFGRALESNAYVDTWLFDTPPPAEQVNMYPGVLTGISLEPGFGAKRIDVLPHLGGTIHCVVRVLDRFTKLFPAPMSPIDLSGVRLEDQMVSTVVPTIS